MNDNGSAASRLWRRVRSDERGAILVLVAFSLVALVALMALTIDIGKQIRATAQAQATADAAALAGAGVLATVGDTALAELEAIDYAARNQVMGKDVTIAPSDVTFPGSAPYDSIHVNVRRTSGSPTGPFPSIFGGFFGIDSLGVERDAMAHAIVSGSPPECVMPFGIPDLWLESPGGTPAGPNDEYDPTSSDPDDGVGDVYTSPTANPNSFSGYQLPRDWGREVTVYNGPGGKGGKGGGTYNPSWWGPWNPVSNAGRGNAFQQAITGANCGLWQEADFEDNVNTTPGAGKGPSTGCFQGGQGCGSGGTPLIDQDPSADWADPGTTAYNSAGCTQARGCMVRPDGGGFKQISSSPRIRPVPLYHPDDVVNSSPGNQTQVRITNFTGVFFDRVDGQQAVVGYVVGLVGSGEDPAPAPNVTTKTIQLVE